MILRIKFNFSQIFKLISILLLINTSNLHPHNLINSACDKQCRKKIKINKNENKLNNFFYQLEIDIKNSCLNKSLCRG
jgi:hypothetical protein